MTPPLGGTATKPAGEGSGGDGHDALSISAGRVTSMIDELAAIGGDGSGAVTRLAYSVEERRAHALVGTWLADLGLLVKQDAVGNTIATLPGRRQGIPAIGVGSHLDSVPHGGAYDGVVGVVGAIELVRVLREKNITLNHPLRVVCFAAEEGARFGEPCIGSKAAAGILPARLPREATDASGVTLADAMTGVSLDPTRIGDARWPASDWAAFLELHIEQGQRLEAAGRTVGLVDVVSGSTRLRLTIEGRPDHSGGTPMDMRADALVAAAEIVLAAESLATDRKHRGTRATVGYVSVSPNSMTTIPGRVTLTVDIRDIDSDRQRQSAIELVDEARTICQRRSTRLGARVIADTSPVVLSQWLRRIVAEAAATADCSYMVLTSGASHDAQIINRWIPSAIIFVPSRNGLSHVPEEWTSSGDIALGVQVLAGAVVRVDAFPPSASRTLKREPGERRD